MNDKRLYSEQQLEEIANWSQNKLSPQAIFGLRDFGNHPGEDEILSSLFGINATCPYDRGTIEKTFRQLRVRTHPDKYSAKNEKDLATTVFQLIQEAKDYLLFTIDRDSEPPRSNVFYQYYYLDQDPSGTPEGRFKNMVKLIGEMKAQEQLVSRAQIKALYDLIESNPALITQTVADKTVFYLASDWNEPELLEMLLKQFPDEENILTETEFGVSPLGRILTLDQGSLLDILLEHYGRSWLKCQLRSYLYSDQMGCKSRILSHYERLFPEESQAIMDEPLFLPALIEMKKIDDPNATRLKAAIIGLPQLYLDLDNDMRRDPYMIIAFLAQRPNEAWLEKIPLRELDPRFAIALADRWPILKVHLSIALHRDGPPYPNYTNYILFRNACLGLLLGITLAALIWHFWPVIALWPEAAQAFFGYGAVVLETLCCFLSPMLIGSYLYSVYPEARKINSILQTHGFFARVPGNGNQIDQTNHPLPGPN